jgi:hypothetical protein
MGVLTAKGRALSDAPAKLTTEKQAAMQASITEKLLVLDGNKQIWAETSPQVRREFVGCMACSTVAHTPAPFPQFLFLWEDGVYRPIS